jgi:hypothetical protein
LMPLRTRPHIRRCLQPRAHLFVRCAVVLLGLVLLHFYGAVLRGTPQSASRCRRHCRHCRDGSVAILLSVAAHMMLISLPHRFASAVFPRGHAAWSAPARGSVMAPLERIQALLLSLPAAFISTLHALATAGCGSALIRAVLGHWVGSFVCPAPRGIRAPPRLVRHWLLLLPHSTRAFVRRASGPCGVPVCARCSSRVVSTPDA